MKEKNPAHYVDNQKLLAAMVEHRKKVVAAKAAGQKMPPVSEYIGECIYKIATRLSTKGNFASYSYREEMVSDGIENCLLYIHNFDPEKSAYPFAYMTKMIFRAFIRRIQQEHEQQYIRHKSFLAAQGDGSLYTLDDTFQDDEVSIPMSSETSADFVKNFEDKIEERKQKQKLKEAEKLVG